MTVKELHKILSEQLYIGNGDKRVEVISKEEWEKMGEISMVVESYEHIGMVLEN